jgi:hypothetical protein
MARNAANARKAYDSARQIAAKVTVSGADSEEIAEKFKELETQLKQVEEQQFTHLAKL